MSTDIICFISLLPLKNNKKIMLYIKIYSARESKLSEQKCIDRQNFDYAKLVSPY